MELDESPQTLVPGLTVLLYVVEDALRVLTDFQVGAAHD
jgi:hypothetical protein